METVTDWIGRLRDMGGLAPLISVLDILAVAYVIYKLMMLVKGTRAWQIMWGLGVFFLLVFISDAVNLRALNWLLRAVLPLGPVALVILFYPELRHALEEMGRLKFLGSKLTTLGRKDIYDMVDQLAKVVADMSGSNVGALIVIERDVGLDDIIANGQRMDALVSAQLLRTIFHPGSPLHDGAVIIRGNRIVAASCTLPLSDSPKVGTMIHTRHKAALGVAEQSDAIVLVVSEETGMISMAVSGDLCRGLNADEVRNRLLELLQATERADGVRQIRETMSSAISIIRPSGSSEQEPKC